MNILSDDFATFLVCMTAFPFISDMREWGTVTESGDIGVRLKALQEGREGGSLGGKNSCLSLSPFSPPQLLCKRLPRALFIISIVPNILDVDH